LQRNNFFRLLEIITVPMRTSVFS